jgi:hypothetical protein
MADISQQLVFVAACRQREKVKPLADLYLLPRVDQFSTLDFGKSNEIRKIGYDHCKEQLNPWLNRLFEEDSEENKYPWMKFAFRNARENL